jgi:hypothetical protein
VLASSIFLSTLWRVVCVGLYNRHTLYSLIPLINLDIASRLRTASYRIASMHRDDNKEPRQIR